ncbi:MAG: hypothetical protein KC468_35265, partial [Myxococcales bacterium]|nr:hypothetical protein [Myxococcales bacterium]
MCAPHGASREHRRARRPNIVVAVESSSRPFGARVTIAVQAATRRREERAVQRRDGGPGVRAAVDALASRGSREVGDAADAHERVVEARL